MAITQSARVSDVTRILDRAQQDDSAAADPLLPLVYDELRKLAAHKLACEAPGQTLPPTALVHEAWLRLVGAEQQTWQNRAHFFAAAPAKRLLPRTIGVGTAKSVVSS